MKPGHLSILTKGDYSFYASHDNVKGAIKTIKFNPHKGNAATIELSESPAEKYAGNGAYSIINGVYGNANKYGGSEWLGFEGLDFEAHLKWQDTIKLNRIDLRFFNAEGQWIYLPAQIRIYKKVKSDYHLIGALDKINSKGTLARVRIAFHGTAANEIKIIAKNYGRIPEGRQGSGHRAWLFVDEIEIN
jgi:hexosaminidase